MEDIFNNWAPDVLVQEELHPEELLQEDVTQGMTHLLNIEHTRATLSLKVRGKKNQRDFTLKNIWDLNS